VKHQFSLHDAQMFQQLKANTCQYISPITSSFSTAPFLAEYYHNMIIAVTEKQHVKNNIS